MEPTEPLQAGTSLEIPCDSDSHPAGRTAGTELELPHDGDVPAVLHGLPGSAEQPAPGPLGNLVVAHFHRGEIASLGRVLIATLSEALPSSMIRLERRRSLGQRLVRRAAEPIGITITAGERVLSLRAREDGVTEATTGHAVRGIVLSSTPVPMGQWLDALGELLEELAHGDEATRTALEQILLS